MTKRTIKLVVVRLIGGAAAVALFALTFAQLFGSSDFFGFSLRLERPLEPLLHLLAVTVAIAIAYLGLDRASSQPEAPTTTVKKPTVLASSFILRTFVSTERPRTYAGIALLAAALVYGIYTQNVALTLVIETLIGVTALRLFLTQYRAGKEYLGTTVSEAEELIAFVVDQSGRNQLPPGAKLKAGLPADKTATDITKQTVIVGSQP